MLRYLDISNNKITKLPLDLFNNLPELKILDLTDNKIAYIESGTFNNLLNLIEF